MKSLLWTALTVAVAITVMSCGNSKPPSAPAVKMRDSTTIMTTHGVSKLISDSGLLRYKVVAEEWRVYDKTNPPRHTFPKGLVLERFNQQFHIEMYITADTAYWYNQNLWELRGRVRVWNDDGTIFNSELLYWDMEKHEFYSNKYSHIITPDREVEGASFRSDEKMLHYTIYNSKATFPVPEEATQEDDSIKMAEQNEMPQPTATVPSRTPTRATEVRDPSLPPGGHFK